MKKKEIKALLDERDALYEKDSESKRVDEIRDEIEAVIKSNFNKYEVDFILETWTRFGAAPCLIYDDNGMFAVTGAGFAPAVFGKKRIKGDFTVFVKKKQWKKTIRKALRHYIFS